MDNFSLAEVTFYPFEPLGHIIILDTLFTNFFL